MNKGSTFYAAFPVRIGGMCCAALDNMDAGSTPLPPSPPQWTMPEVAHMGSGPEHKLQEEEHTVSTSPHPSVGCQGYENGSGPSRSETRSQVVTMHPPETNPEPEEEGALTESVNPRPRAVGDVDMGNGRGGSSGLDGSPRLGSQGGTGSMVKMTLRSSGNQMGKFQMASAVSAAISGQISSTKRDAARTYVCTTCGI